MESNKKTTLDSLAEMSQKEFLAIRGEMATGFTAVRAEMATKQDLENLKSDFRLEFASKSDLESAKSYIVDEIKTFMQPHVKSLDTVLVDVENLKERISK